MKTQIQETTISPPAHLPRNPQERSERSDARLSAFVQAAYILEATRR
jgi:hypothetical protein